MANDTLLSRFASKVERGNSEAQCWNWTGARTKNGYGALWNSGSMAYAHRISYEVHVGPIPDGKHIDHLCRNRRCVNPKHLEPVDSAVNTLRGVGLTAINARLTSCLRGHPFDDDNTRIDRRGKRVCRACRRSGNTRTAAA